MKVAGKYFCSNVKLFIYLCVHRQITNTNQKTIEAMTTESENLNAYELKRLVSNFIDREFNFITLNVVETMAGDTLCEYIRQPEANSGIVEMVYYDLNTGEKIDLIADYIDQELREHTFGSDTVKRGLAARIMSEYSFMDITEGVVEESNYEGYITGEAFEDFVQEQLEDEVQEKLEYETGENYPMWGTCFEFRYEPSEEVIQAAIDAGFGVIEGMEDFNTMLFVSGCGYSFYGAHWIPLYLNLPYNKELKATVESLEINYKNQ